MNDKPKIEEKLVRHDFTQAEKLTIGDDLARAHGKAREVEIEAKQSKAQYAAREAEAASAIDRLSTSLVNGWEMRNKRCRVEFVTKERKKKFFPEIKDGIFEAKPAAIEDMTAEDFERDLFEAESKFERRAELPAFKDGLLIVGRMNGKWFTAIRAKVGSLKLDERLNPEGKGYKDRFGAIKATTTRLMAWIAEKLGDESAKGFKAQVDELLKKNEEVVE